MIKKFQIPNTKFQILNSKYQIPNSKISSFIHSELKFKTIKKSPINPKNLITKLLFNSIT
ncbi:hypothetical protein MB09_11800 [Aequorivita vladivostokensis]|uniref:Uncharacterized protein n=1 Tax=Aequorivita vladivostokensis TaxID=171194 RepID=A0ABR5DGT1_9FLAO|nr:hypothetical protein MB09_11800 [Aequorivita vladivostokensis]